MLSTYDFLLIGIGLVILIFSFSVGVERMIKIIIGNYLLISITLATDSFLDLIIRFLDSQTITFLKNIDKIENFLFNNKVGIILVIYFILLILIFAKSNISIGITKNKIGKFFLSLIFAPLTVLSIFLGLEIAIFGGKIFQINQILEVAQNFASNKTIYYFILMTPIWVIIPGVLTIIFSTEFDISGIKSKFLGKKNLGDGDHNEEEYGG